MVSEREILNHFGGLGNGHLWEFGLPEAGPDLGGLSQPKNNDSNKELLANSRAWSQMGHELLPHTP